MKKPYIWAIAGILLLAAGAGVFLSLSTGGASTNQKITAAVNEAFEGKPYFKAAHIYTYKGLEQQPDGDTSKAGAVSVLIEVDEVTGATYKDVALTMPPIKAETVFYKINQKDVLTPEINPASQRQLNDPKFLNDVAQAVDLWKTDHQGKHYLVYPDESEKADDTKIGVMFSDDTKIGVPEFATKLHKLGVKAPGLLHESKNNRFYEITLTKKQLETYEEDAAHLETLLDVVPEKDYGLTLTGKTITVTLNEETFKIKELLEELQKVDTSYKVVLKTPDDILEQ